MLPLHKRAHCHPDMQLPFPLPNKPAPAAPQLRLPGMPASAGASNAGLRQDAGFHTTHWTMVLAARDKDGTVAREALASLCSTYWYPLYAFIRRQGSSPHQAEDLTQEFFARFLERHSLGSVQPAAGKFRSFLLACLKNFLAKERERAHAQRRGGGRAPFFLACTEAGRRYARGPPDI